MNEIYEAPELTMVGTVESLTAATHTGAHLDGNYPTHTPLSNPIAS